MAGPSAQAVGLADAEDEGTDTTGYMMSGLGSIGKLGAKSMSFMIPIPGMNDDADSIRTQSREREAKTNATKARSHSPTKSKPEVIPQRKSLTILEADLLAKSSSENLKYVVPDRSELFANFTRELQASPFYSNLLTRDLDAVQNVSDWWAYKLENAIATDPNTRFYVLLGLAVFLAVALAWAWASIIPADSEYHFRTADFWGALYMTGQVLFTGGYDSTGLKLDERVIYGLMVFTGKRPLELYHL